MRAAAFLLALAFVAAGCAHAPPATDGLDMAARRARLESLPGWDMRGRLAIDTGERAYQARFRWLQRPDSLLLSVRGIFGAGSFEIDGNEAALMLRRGGERHALADPEADLEALYGWWLPVGSLDAWLIGLPDERYDAQTRLARDGTLTALEQRLWTLEFADYGLGDGTLIPRSIEMRHGPLHLRLTVDSWNPLAATSDALN